MLVVIEKVLDKNTVQEFRRLLDAASWEDGRASAGAMATLVKSNEQLPENHELAVRLGNHVVKVLGQHPLFISAALPATIYPPKFNRYQNGGHYGIHVDGAIMPLPGSRSNIRSDLSATLFLSEPEEYDGGELVIEGQFGAQSVKLAAGDMVLYPSSSLHQVTPVTRGARVASFFWMQSMVRDQENRALLFDLDQNIQALLRTLGNKNNEVLRLTHVYHNLLRRWAEV